jgi:hypothetical protein
MIVEVNLEKSLSFDSFESLLNKYKDYKSFFREIKINSLIDKGSQFCIEDIYPPLICGLDPEHKNSQVFRLLDSCFRVKSMNFIIKSNLLVDKISLDIEILDTPHGKLLKDMIDLVIFKLEYIHTHDEINIIGFYATTNQLVD